MTEPNPDDLGECIALPKTSSEKATSRRSVPRDDVRWDNVEHLVEQEVEIPLAPIDREVERARAAAAAEAMRLPPPPVEEPVAPQYQFSLREILILNTVLAVIFALLRALAPSWVAGTLGVTTLATAILLAVYQPENRRVEMAWWCMLLVYVAACGFAIYGAS